MYDLLLAVGFLNQKTVAKTLAKINTSQIDKLDMNQVQNVNSHDGG